MKICIIGKGSIGVRHSKIFKKLGAEIYFFRTSKNLKTYKTNFKHKEFFNIKELNNLRFNLIVISNPSSLHLKTLIKFSKFSNNFLIEKPLTSSLKETLTLKKFILSKKKTIFTGYFLRYYINILNLKKFISKKRVKVKFANFSWHTYMPSWHEGENYKKSYALNKNLGGGVINTCCHEIDLALFFFGPVKEVYAKEIKSNTNYDVETSVIIILKHKNDIISQINLDFLSKNNKRSIKIFSDEKLIKFDFRKNSLLEENKNVVKNISFKKFHNITKAYEEQNKFILKNLDKSFPYTRTKKIIDTEKIIHYCKKSLKKNEVIRIK